MRISSTGANKGKVPKTTNHTTEALKPRREVGIDVWRGIAVMFMIITHAVAFFHVGADPVITNIGIFGGTTSFILFLFLSGASSYFAYVKYEKDKHGPEIARRQKKILIRTLFILLGYYLVALVAVIPFLSFPPDAATWGVIFKVITFQTTPPFTEFILAFVLFNLSLILFRPIYNFMTKFPPVLFLFSLSMFALGSVLWQVDVAEPLANYKALLSGHGEIHSFPLLQYSVVYFLGMSWGRFLFRTPSKKIRKVVTRYAILAAGLLTFAGVASFSILSNGLIDPVLRWPPSLTLMAVGILTGYLIWYLLLLTNNGRSLGPLQVLFHYMGTKAFDFFIFHTIILFAYSYISGEQRHESPIVVLGLFVLLVALTFVVVAVFENIITSLKENSRSKTEYGWIFSERLVVSSIWIFVVILIGLTGFQTQVSATSIDPEEVSFKKRLLREEPWPFWWDNSYTAFRQLTIDNNGAFPAAKGSWYEFTFNHKQAVNKRGSSKTGEDVRIVYYNEFDDLFLEVPFSFEGINTNTSTIRFALLDEVASNTLNDKYFIYYGNPDVNGFTAAQNAPNTGRTGSITLSEEFLHRVSGSIDKRWHLKEGISGLTVRTMKYKIQLNNDLSPESIVTFNVAGTDIRGPMDNLGEGKYEALVPVGDLEPGVYKVQSITREPENKLTLIGSDQKTFYVTYPLYVVWTQDWEGWDISDQLLRELDQMARRYKMPMTHYFNPRIYVNKGVSKNRADALTLWVQERARTQNDEIALHLHMWTDMVIAAGVTPRYGPAAPWLYGDGGGVLASAYTKGEFKKILNWSKKVFQDNGLVSPTSFRAGGWFTEEHTLQALAETGFLVDSSGRVKPVNDGQLADPRIASYPPPWNLSSTTQPYIPSRQNMNKEGSPNIDIWEFPNNGGDSYWYKTSELIARFNENYRKKGSILMEPQVVNYLSHPPFFRIDQPKMTAVFNHTNKFLNRNDDGPVVYTTLENAYYGYLPWGREQTKIN